MKKRIVFNIVILLVILGSYFSFKEKDNSLVKNSYEITEYGGKEYAVLDKSFISDKIIVAESDIENSSIIINFSNIEMLDLENQPFHFKNFDTVIYKNKQFSTVKDKNLVYFKGYTYKIENETSDNVTVTFKKRKEVNFDKLVPLVNNERIPSNYLNFYEGEKTLTIKF